ncbi:MAG: ribonuclease P protein component [Chloroflexota bacterium]
MRGKEYLTKPGQYTSVYTGGSSWASGLVVVRTLPNSIGFSRYGFSVSRRIGTAVVRNKVKRRLREITRQLPIKAGWDIVFIARQAAATAKYAELKSIIENLLKKAGFLETPLN